MKKDIAIIGGGPAGLFMYKKLLESGKNFSIDIFEAKNTLGSGMPYSPEGANHEHITNVSGNEIPKLMIPVVEWIKNLAPDALKKYNLVPEDIHEFMVLPRLLFGEYLTAQYDLLLEKAGTSGAGNSVHYNCMVTDIEDDPAGNKIKIQTPDNKIYEFDIAIICTGHHWPVKHEGQVHGYYDSPYPPVKLKKIFNHEIAIRGSSLTAIDAVRTLARSNGSFHRDDKGILIFRPDENANEFKITMHSRHGLLPAVRFHLDDSHLSNKSLLTKEGILAHREQNDGFLSLDFIFEKDFKDLFKEKDPQFYQQIRDMTMEDFVSHMMSLRERIDPFDLLKEEYREAEKSIKRKQSIYWKEMLGVLSFAMNYPAKHLSAEDMIRLQKVLMPLISIVIAYVPQGSCEEMIALHDSGRLGITDVGDDSEVEVNNGGGIIYHYRDTNGQKQEKAFQTFIDCTGQKHLSMDNFPFGSLVREHRVTPARLKFREPASIIDPQNKDIEGNYLRVPGIAITDDFNAIDKDGNVNGRLYVMAVPYIGGFNPDYSGLDFCEAASGMIAGDIVKNADHADV
jgi:uncharacterized NAD(P)/FAD-binding protein YdhS